MDTPHVTAYVEPRLIGAATTPSFSAIDPRVVELAAKLIRQQPGVTSVRYGLTSLNPGRLVVTATTVELLGNALAVEQDFTLLDATYTALETVTDAYVLRVGFRLAATV